MLEKVKPIIAVFLKTPADLINASTVIDRGAVGSSVHVHRMYARLAAEGMPVKDYQTVITVADLLQRVGIVNGQAAVGNGQDMAAANGSPMLYDAMPAAPAAPSVSGLGIDMEEIAAMPVTDDFREDEFYTMNFAPSEIAYCILKPHPYASFAGMFAAKEAIVKADNNYKNRPFNNIIVRHLPGGQPFHEAFDLSISHTDQLAIAIAQLRETETVIVPAAAGTGTQTGKSSFAGIWILALLSLVLSLAAIFLALKK
jgi:phosphopantetheine--protein transferase-like protein